MKITFKTETEILKEVEITNEMPDEVFDDLKTSFDDKLVKKYEIIFKEGILVKQTHAMKASDAAISELILTIEK